MLKAEELATRLFPHVVSINIELDEGPEDGDHYLRRGGNNRPQSRTTSSSDQPWDMSGLSRNSRRRERAMCRRYSGTHKVVENGRTTAPFAPTSPDALSVSGLCLANFPRLRRTVSVVELYVT